MVKNKKGQLSLVVKLIFIGLIITVVASTVFNKNFYYDALDFIENLFQPPEVDPLPSTTRALIARERALDYLEDWVDAFERMKYSEEPYCYERIPATTRESREHELGVLFSSNKEDSFEIRLSGPGGASLSSSFKIDAPLCLVAQPRRSDSDEAGDLLSNFRDAFYSGEEAKKAFCLNNPEQCVLIFSKPEVLSDGFASYENFGVDFLINSPEEADRRNSFYLRYFLYNDLDIKVNASTLTQEQLLDETSEVVFDDSSGKLTDSDFVLFKLEDNLCIMPLSTANLRCETIWARNNRKAGDIRILRRSCFFNRDSSPNDALNAIPRCSLTLDEQISQIISDPLNPHVEVTIEFEGDSNQRNKLVFVWDNLLPRKEWHLVAIPMDNYESTTVEGEDGEEVAIDFPTDEITYDYLPVPVSNESLLNTNDPDNNILPLHDKLRGIIIDLRGKNLEEGLLIFFDYKNDEDIKKLDFQTYNEYSDNPIWDVGTVGGI